MAAVAVRAPTKTPKNSESEKGEREQKTEGEKETMAEENHV